MKEKCLAFGCGICPFKCHVLWLLDEHIEEVHKGVEVKKPFKCLYCDKRFKDTFFRSKHYREDHDTFRQVFTSYTAIRNDF